METPTPNSDRIAIIGAGPVGLSLAAGLASYGIPVAVYEDDNELSSAPKAGTVTPRTLEIFDRLGVVEETLKDGIRLESVDFAERGSERQLMRIDMTELRHDTAFPFFLNLPQHEFEPILLARAEEFGAEIHFGHKLISLDQDDDGCTLEFETSNGTVEVRAPYALGCDGGRSAVRRQLGLRLNEITPEEQFLVVNLKAQILDADGHPPESMSYLCDADGFFTRVRLPHVWRVGWALPADAPQSTDEEIEVRLRKELRGQPFELLDWAQYSAQGRIVENMRVGRAFLAGDSAHLILPIGGLGLNTGFEDAFNLTWKLVWVLRGWAPPELLDTYSAERVPTLVGTARAMSERSRTFMQLGRNPIVNRLRTGMRSALLRSEGRRWTSAYHGSLLGLNYRRRPPQGRVAKLRQQLPPLRPPIVLGDRSPDGILTGPDGRSVRLHDLFGENFVAVTFVERPAEAELLGDPPDGLTQVLISRRDASLDSPARARSYFDVRGTLTKRFGAKPDSTYLVRPDDFVAAIVSAAPAEILAAYEGFMADAVNARPAPSPF